MSAGIQICSCQTSQLLSQSLWPIVISIILSLFELQFEEEVLDCVLDLLGKSRLKDHAKWDPVKIARTISAAVSIFPEVSGLNGKPVYGISFHLGSNDEIHKDYLSTSY